MGLEIGAKAKGLATVLWQGITRQPRPMATDQQTLQSNLEDFHVVSSYVAGTDLTNRYVTKEILVNFAVDRVVPAVLTTAGAVSGGAVGAIGGFEVAQGTSNLVHLVADPHIDNIGQSHHISLANRVNKDISNVIRIYTGPSFSPDQQVQNLTELQAFLNEQYQNYSHTNPANADGLALGIINVQKSLNAIQQNTHQRTVAQNSDCSDIEIAASQLMLEKLGQTHTSLINKIINQGLNALSLDQRKDLMNSIECVVAEDETRDRGIGDRVLNHVSALTHNKSLLDRAMARIASYYGVSVERLFNDKRVSSSAQQLVQNQLALQTYYKQLRQRAAISQFQERIAHFQSMGDTFEMLEKLGSVSNNQKLVKIGAAGRQIAGILTNITKLGSPIALNGFAAINPVLGIATGVFALAGLFRKNKNKNRQDPMMQQLCQIENQISAIHKTIVNGFGILVQGQQTIYNTLNLRFNKLEFLIHKQHEITQSTFSNNLHHIEDLLTLIHQDLSQQIQLVVKQPFDRLRELLLDAMSDHYPSELRKEKLKKRANKEIIEFENWLTQPDKVKMQNGSRYVNFLQNKDIQNPQTKLNAYLIHNENLCLGYFMSYLAQLVFELLPDFQLGNEEIQLMINPDFWLQGVGTYIDFRNSLTNHNIEFYPDPHRYARMKSLGKNYIGFILSIQNNRDAIFKALFNDYQSSYEGFKFTIRENYLRDVCEELKMKSHDSLNRIVPCNYDKEGFVKKYISPPELQQQVLNEFEIFSSDHEKELQWAFESSVNKLKHILFEYIDNKSIEEIEADVDCPIWMFAKHRGQTKKGESHLEVYHHHEHFSNFYDYNFDLSFSIRKIFEHNELLKNSIPSCFYVAEALGLGVFEIDFIAKYPSGSHKFTDAAYAQLNAKSVYNYQFIFTVRFKSSELDANLCQVTCNTEQIPISDLAAGEIVLRDISQLMSQVHVGVPGYCIPQPFEYWALANCRNKIHAMQHIKLLTKICSLTKNTTEDQNAQHVATLRKLIKGKLDTLKSNYYQSLKSLARQDFFKNHFENIEASKNIIIAFLHMCGIKKEQIECLKQVFLDRDKILLNIENTTPLPYDLQEAQSQLNEAIKSTSSVFWEGYRLAEIKFTLAQLILLESDENSLQSELEDLIDSPEGQLSDVNSAQPVLSESHENKRRRVDLLELTPVSGQP